MDREAILDLIVVKSREGQVFEIARQLARNYEFDEDLAVELFEFMVTVGSAQRASISEIAVSR